MNVEIANHLAKLRKDHQMSQEELAAKIGVSRQAISKWERAESSPDTDNLILLADLYQISLDELLLSGQQRPQSAAEPQQQDQQQTKQQKNVPFCRQCRQEDAEEAAFFRLFPYPIFITVIYLMLGYSFDWWHPGWILYLTIPIYYSFGRYFHKRKQKRER